MINATAIFIPALLLCVYCYRKIARQERQSSHALSEIGSFYPVIAPELCGGCGTCVEACPEGEVLGLINGKAALVQPAKCVGHGACMEVCPLDAITKESGTGES